MIRVKLREAIRAYERRTGERMTYALLAERTGLSRATVEALGSRASYNATLGTIERVCSALECGLGDLLERSPDSGDASS